MLCYLYLHLVLLLGKFYHKATNSIKNYVCLKKKIMIVNYRELLSVYEQNTQNHQSVVKEVKKFENRRKYVTEVYYKGKLTIIIWWFLRIWKSYCLHSVKPTLLLMNHWNFMKDHKTQRTEKLAENCSSTTMLNYLQRLWYWSYCVNFNNRNIHLRVPTFCQSMRHVFRQTKEKYCKNRFDNLSINFHNFIITVLKPSTSIIFQVHREGNK